MDDDRETPPVVALAVELNRCLFEGRGNDFAATLGRYVRATDLVIDAAAFERLEAAVRSVRQGRS